MKIILRKISDINPAKYNPRKITEHELSGLKESIKKFGFVEPLIVNIRSGFLVGGHQRLRAAESLGFTEVPTVEVDLSPVEEKALNVALNSPSISGKYDGEILSGLLKEIKMDMPDLFTNLNMDELMPPVEILPSKGLTDPDYVPELPKEPITKRGDIWILGNHRLMCGDSTMINDVEKLMSGEKADLWIADPPFGVSYMEKNAAVNGGIVKNQTDKEIKSDTKTIEELCPFWRDTALNAYLVTTMEASNYWCACQGSDKMMMMMMMMDEAGWNIRHELIWVKDNFVFGRSDYHYRHEPIIYGWKKKGKHNWYSDRKQDSVIEIPRPKRSDLHPTTKPVELFEKFITNSSKLNDLVFESFGGSGTSIMASTKLNRRCNTMELSESYCDVIVKRWQDFTGLKATLEKNGESYDNMSK